MPVNHTTNNRKVDYSTPNLPELLQYDSTQDGLHTISRNSMFPQITYWEAKTKAQENLKLHDVEKLAEGPVLPGFPRWFTRERFLLGVIVFLTLTLITSLSIVMATHRSNLGSTWYVESILRVSSKSLSSRTTQSNIEQPIDEQGQYHWTGFWLRAMSLLSGPACLVFWTQEQRHNCLLSKPAEAIQSANRFKETSGSVVGRPRTGALKEFFSGANGPHAISSRETSMRNQDDTHLVLD